MLSALRLLEIRERVATHYEWAEDDEELWTAVSTDMCDLLAEIERKRPGIRKLGPLRIDKDDIAVVNDLESPLADVVVVLKCGERIGLTGDRARRFLAALDEVGNAGA